MIPALILFGAMVVGALFIAIREVVRVKRGLDDVDDYWRTRQEREQMWRSRR